MNESTELVVAWSNIEQTTGVAKPYGSNAQRARVNLDFPINLEQYWLTSEKLENSNLSPRLYKRYSLMLGLMYRLQLSIGGILKLRGEDLKKHSSKLKELDLPMVKNFDFVFRSPNKSHVPLPRSQVVAVLCPLIEEELEAWKDAA